MALKLYYEGAQLTPINKKANHQPWLAAENRRKMLFKFIIAFFCVVYQLGKLWLLPKRKAKNMLNGIIFIFALTGLVQAIEKLVKAVKK